MDDILPAIGGVSPSGRKGNRLFRSGSKKLEKIAEILVDYSIKLKSKETVILQLRDLEAMPLLLATYEKVLARGAYAILTFNPREIEKIYFKKAKKNQLEFIPLGHEINVKKADASINFGGLEPGNYLKDANPKKMAMRARATQKLDTYFVNNVRWVLVGYPTQIVIKESGLSKQKFLNLYFSSIIQNWRKKKKEMTKIKKIFDNAEEVVILGEKTDLTLSLKNRPGVICGGTYNMPDGEIMYAPREKSVEGEIYFDFPVSFNGKEIKGAVLKFSNGKVVKFSAKSGKKNLAEILKTDAGAKRVGEFGIGLNYGIKDYINNTLFDEKIGGTIHLALGRAYEECRGKNKSAIHFDMVKDLRKKSEIWVDGKQIFKNGKFII
jgi:aminopeptidase